MKATGIVRPLVMGGRIVLPVELRRSLDLSAHTSMEYLVMDGAIALRKHQPACLFCGKTDDVLEFNGQQICRSCAREMARRLRSRPRSQADNRR